MSWIRVPIIERIGYREQTVFEHVPLDYYRYGEYPRYIMLPGCYEPKWEWKYIKPGK